MDYQRGIVLYDLQGTAQRLGVSVATVKRQAAVLRELGTLVWLVHGSKRNLRVPGRKYTATATVYGAVIPPCYDIAMGHVLQGTGYDARIVGVTEEGREQAVQQARSLAQQKIRANRSKQTDRAVSPRREPHSLGRTPHSETVEVNPGVKDTSRKRASRSISSTVQTNKQRTASGPRRPVAQVARDILIARQVRPLVGWTQTEGLRRLAFALRPLIDKGLDVHDIAAELHSWYLVWHPAKPAAYITAQLRKHAGSSIIPDAVQPLTVAPQDSAEWRAWCERNQAAKAMTELIETAPVRTAADRAQARLAAQYNPHMVIDHVEVHGEDDALDLFGTQLVARLVGLSHSSHVHLGTA
ncbi:cell wall protein [Streptomyces sp. AV19]|uniref:cell wall protein n=1 Tax=Streptomyces sp. AV19 TaxID=2793068 RepID=UPI0018FEDEEC|nr:cell wall protein [Streptomyces sp. AV19]MBH1939260.1 cell wall protein [Streptomyces sp. AV19]MDG4536960.1 cell wall protein [Streptomyces sp. AV19]